MTFVQGLRGTFLCLLLLSLTRQSFAQADPLGRAVDAIRLGRLDSVRAMLDAGLDAEEEDNNGNSLLMTAAFHQKPEIITLLLDRGGDPNAANKQGATPLMIAVAGGNEEIARLLLDRGAKVNKRDKRRKKSALMIAVTQGHLGLTDLMLGHGADVNEQDYCGLSPLMVAAAYGNQEMARLLIRSGADCGAASSKYSIPVGDVTILVDGRAVGPLVFTTAVWDVTPLMYAAEHGHRDVVLDLLRCDADPEARDSWERAARTWADSGGQRGLIALLDSVRFYGRERVLASEAPAQDVSSGYDRPPELVAGVKELTLSPHESGLRQQGMVRVRVRVNAEGEVAAAYVTGCNLDIFPMVAVGPAIAVVRRFTYRPAMREGKPVEGWLTVSFTVIMP